MIERAEVVSAAEARVLSLTETFALSWRRTLDSAVSLGGALADLKAELGHGAWLPWLQSRFPLGPDMAERFMFLSRNSEDLRILPEGTSIDAAYGWLKKEQRAARGPRPLPEPNGAVLEGPGEPALRAGIDRDTADIVADILRVCFPDARTALDATYGSGNFWNGTAHVVVTGTDMDPARAFHGVVDFRDLSVLVEAGAAFDVVLLDPPHLADSSDDSVMGERFGTAPADDLEAMVTEGVIEAWRVARLGIVVRVTDHVHGQVFVSESDWVRDALDGLVPFEVVHQVRSKSFVDPKWALPQLSFYNNLSTYLIFRHGDQKHAR